MKFFKTLLQIVLFFELTICVILAAAFIAAGITPLEYTFNTFMFQSFSLVLFSASYVGVKLGWEA